jgi:RES domain-containing protein
VHGGRWNRPGTAVVYTSSSLALAALELFVHLRPAMAPSDLVAIGADIPDSVAVSEIRVSRLGRDWTHHPAPESLADLGTRWAQERRTAVLIVPSAIIPRETNYLLNPLHPAFKTIRIGRPERFVFDRRLTPGV